MRAALIFDIRMPRLFVDLDGVIADFDKRVFQLTGRRPDDFEFGGAMWKAIRPPQCLNFYGSLDLMPDAMELWSFVAPYKPTILTGLPIGNWAEPQKRAWVASTLGPDVPVICCMARDKHKHCRPGDILVDDRAEKAREPWEAAGGIFVHHTSSRKSVEELRRLLPALPKGAGHGTGASTAGAHHGAGASGASGSGPWAGGYGAAGGMGQAQSGVLDASWSSGAGASARPGSSGPVSRPGLGLGMGMAAWASSGAASAMAGSGASSGSGARGETSATVASGLSSAARAGSTGGLRPSPALSRAAAAAAAATGSPPGGFGGLEAADDVDVEDGGPAGSNAAGGSPEVIEIDGDHDDVAAAGSGSAGASAGGRGAVSTARAGAAAVAGSGIAGSNGSAQPRAADAAGSQSNDPS